MKIDNDRSKMDLSMIHNFLSNESKWAEGISLELVEKSINNSLCFAGYLGGKQIAFARVVSDFTTFANLVDVFVLPDFRGKRYGKELMKAVIAHPDLQGLRRFTLATSNAHSFYEKYGFTRLSNPKLFMERYDPNVYL